MNVFQTAGRRSTALLRANRQFQAPQAAVDAHAARPMRSDLTQLQGRRAALRRLSVGFKCSA